ncbi:retroviral-like aspartic protease family protein [Sphaerotilus montanus]|uniref:Aspartyl protease family protein n=1 Tax=Sphaerotilus montanus TaxID=522889 RepID=A0A7Y9UKT0_9BURK|nr:retropepsin-like aspartic protease [Sphaerotilus montanus]NYG34035.1 aspartyl protease family protein [Sphaerotilus montanus]NZD55985.1 retroviral-like aspartic protease family protein [Sphaerotilus montanus]
MSGSWPIGRFQRVCARGGAAALALGALAVPGPGRAAGAPTVVLAGTMGDKVVLVIDGRTRVMTVGETADGLRVQRGAAGQSVVVATSGGVQRELVVGAAPVTVGGTAAGAAQRLVLEAGSDRLFHAGGEINGQAVQGVVDTGASLVVLSTQLARRLGVDWQAGTSAQVQTASGRSAGRRVRLAQVRLGPLQARDVEAVVIDSDMPYVLYGNSFLQGFRLQWEQGRLSLTP